MNYSDIKPAAVGQWRAILSAIAGLSEKELSNKHQPCPACGGKDRYRFDDKDGEGTYLCNVCGAGDGIDLLIKVTGLEFREAVNSVADYLGTTGENYQVVKRTIKPRPEQLTDRKQNHIDPAIAAAWINKAEPIPFTEYTLNQIISPQNLRGSEKAAVVPVEAGGEVVNAAAIFNDGSIQYAAGGFTYGGYSVIGEDNGKSYFICHNWVDAWLTHAATNCRVLCVWSPFNFFDAYQQIKKDYQNKPIYLALNNEKNELISAEELGIKCIIPSSESGTIFQDRKFNRRLYEIGDLLDV